MVTSLGGPSGRTVTQDIYLARGQAENHIKSWNTHLAAVTGPKLGHNRMNYSGQDVGRVVLAWFQVAAPGRHLADRRSQHAGAVPANAPVFGNLESRLPP